MVIKKKLNLSKLLCSRSLAGISCFFDVINCVKSHFEVASWTSAQVIPLCFFEVSIHLKMYIKRLVLELMYDCSLHEHVVQMNEDDTLLGLRI